MGKQKKKKFYRVNHYIQASQVRVVDENGKQIRVMPLSDALAQAQSQGLDLVEIAPTATPPVCKLIDFKKFKYLEAKKKSSQKTRKTETKEIRLNLFIAENDLNNRLEKAKQFLKAKHQVKIVVRFKGRQIAKKEFGYKLIGKALESLDDLAHVYQEPRLIGRQLILTLNPNEKSKKDQTQNTKLSQKEI